jgi:hypothetical protein
MILGLIATGPAFALFAQHKSWSIDRKQASLTPKFDLDPDGADKLSSDRTESRGFNARRRIFSRSHGRRRRL